MCPCGAGKHATGTERPARRQDVSEREIGSGCLNRVGYYENMEQNASHIGSKQDNGTLVANAESNKVIFSAIILIYYPFSI